MIGIENVKGREIIDSRGNPTLEIEIILHNGISQYASVPSGASVGLHEAIELRDYDIDRYHGMGLLKSIDILNTIIKPLIEKKRFDSIQALDNLIIEVDGTENKSRIGANTSLALSLAFAKCLAIYHQIPLYKVIATEYYSRYNKMIDFKPPIPMLNVINGGKHANNGLVLQEFMIVPTIQSSIQNKIRLSCEFFADLKETLQLLGQSTSVGDEGGFAPLMTSSHDALDLLMKVLSKSRYNDCFKIAIDAAASTFYNANTKNYDLYDDDDAIMYDEMIAFYAQLINDYPIISIEDPISEEDIEGWKHMTATFNDQIMVIGDDLFVTNTNRLQYGISNNLANAILIKPNQIGTITETIDAVHLARSNQYEVIVSHRSGETEDISLSHIAVGLGASYIKAGAPCRSERVSKYNELMRIFL